MQDTVSESPVVAPDPPGGHIDTVDITSNINGTIEMNDAHSQDNDRRSPQAINVCDNVLPRIVSLNNTSNPISNAHTPLLSTDTARDNDNITDIEDSNDLRTDSNNNNDENASDVNTYSEQQNNEIQMTDYDKLLALREIYQNTECTSKDYYFINHKWLQLFLKGNFIADSFSLQKDIGSVRTFDRDPPTKLYPKNFIPLEKMKVLIDYLGLAEGNEYLMRRKVYSPRKNKEILDLNPLFIVPHIFCGNPSQVNRYSNLLRQSNELMISSQMTVYDFYREVLQFFNLENMPLSDVKLWTVEFDSSHVPLVMVPSSVKRIKEKKLIAKKKPRKVSLKKLGVKSSHVLLEIRDQDGLFPLDLDSHVMLGSGLVGLNNLGNTCYMNSALQCLLHVSELNEYFLYRFFEKEVNKENPLGNNGRVAISFGNLVSSVFDYRNIGNQSSYAPRDFKMTIGHFNSLFADYHQQDSQEFIAFLLDGLHEDLNRVLKKPYVEKPELEEGKECDLEAVKELAQRCWDTHKLRNNSVIVDLFVALYKSTLICPECSRVSITFDPYNDLTLPLPIKSMWSHKIKILPEFGTPKMLEVQLPKGSLYADLKQYISKYTGIPSEELMGFDVFKNAFYKSFEDADSDSRYMPISELINKNDDIWFYQVKKNDGDSVHVVYSTSSTNDTNGYSVVLPFFITLTPDERCSYGAITSKMNSKYAQLSTSPLFLQLKDTEYGKHKVGDFEFIENLLDTIGLEVPIARNDDNRFNEDEDCSSIISYADPHFCNEKIFNAFILESTKEQTPVYNRFHRSKRPENSENSTVWLPQNNNSIFMNDLPSLWDNLPGYQKLFYYYDEKEIINGRDLNKSTGKSDLASRDHDEVLETESTTSSSIISDGSKSSNDLDSAKSGTCKYIEVMSNDENAEDEKIIIDKENFSEMGDQIEVDEKESELKDKENDDEAEQEEGDDDKAEIDSFHTAGCPTDQSTTSLNSKIPRKMCEKQEKQSFLSPMSAIVNKFSYENFELYFGSDSDGPSAGCETWTKPELLINEELAEERKMNAENAKKPVTIYDCLELFSKPEVLGQNDLWYCPKCKDHRQATKKIELWSAPDILTIHLKRFESTRSFSDKIDIVVDFPIEGLDLTKYISDENGDHIYDLFAVDNHYGGLGGGHYTAYVKNFVDDKWYYFDDSRVSEVVDPRVAIKGSAYLLFYRKRSETPLGGEFFWKMNEEIQKKRQKLEEFLVSQQKEISNQSHQDSEDETAISSENNIDDSTSDEITDREDGYTSTEMDVDVSIDADVEDGNKRRKLVHLESTDEVNESVLESLSGEPQGRNESPSDTETIAGDSNSELAN